MQSVLEYMQKADGIHEIVFSVASRASIVELMTRLDDILTQHQDAHYILLDLRESGMLPLRYLGHSLRSLLQRHPEHGQIFVAMVLDDAVLLNVTSALLRTIFRRDHVQYFDRYDYANMWLRLEKYRSTMRETSSDTAEEAPPEV
ncbi:MAG: hypothetical protein KC496_11405 [Anaerolineae bacterium]|nr:hypothetical protein [Anaerolineae bacterium]